MSLQFARHCASAALLAGLLLGTMGFVINDETDQASALHNVVRGSLLVREHPHQFYTTQHGEVNVAIRYPGPAPIGSTLLDYPAAATVFAMRAADSVAPLRIWLGAAACVLAWSFVPRDKRTSGATAAALVLFVVLTAGFRGPEPDLHRWEDAIALQLTNLAFLWLTTFFVALVVRRRVQGNAASLVVAAIVLGPLLFWSSRAKYTELAILFTAIAAWLFGEPRARNRNLALGLVAAFAIWNNIGQGAVLALGIGLWILWDSLRGQRIGLAARAVGWAGLGLLVGLVPWMMENQSVHGNPFIPSYLVLDQGSAVQGGGLLDAIHKFSLALMDGDQWRGPLDFLKNLAGAWTTGDHVEGRPIGLLALSPMLGFAAFAKGRRWLDPVMVGCGLVVLAQLALLTNRVAHQGWGYDARLLAPVIPAVGALAATGIAPFLEGMDDRRTWSSWMAVALCFLAAVLFLLVCMQLKAMHYGLTVWGTTRWFLLGWAALSVVSATVLALLARRTSWAFLRPYAPATIAGMLVAVPLVWTFAVGLASAGAVPTAEDDHQDVSAFLPVMDMVRPALGHVFLPPGPLPLVIADGRTVFDPDYGYCDTNPSPCPWATHI